MNFVIKKKLEHDATIGYETFKAVDSEDNTEVKVKLYLRNTPDLALPSVWEQYYWTYKDAP